MTTFNAWVTVTFEITAEEKKHNDEHAEWMKKNFPGKPVRLMYEERSILRLEIDALTEAEARSMVGEELKSHIWSTIRKIKSFKVGKVKPKPPRKSYSPLQYVVKYVKPGCFRDTMYRSFDNMAQVEEFLDEPYCYTHDGHDPMYIERAAIYTIKEVRDAQTS